MGATLAAAARANIGGIPRLRSSRVGDRLLSDAPPSSRRSPAAIGAVAGGAHRVVVLRGEAGIGKTSLLAELGRRAAAGRFLVLEGRSTELERDVPLAPVLELLARLA